MPGLFEQFPHTNLHELNLDWLIDTINQFKEELEDSAVLSVNGQTGHVTLYESENVILPPLPSGTDQWRLVRLVNGQYAGILFYNGNAYIQRGNETMRVLTLQDIPSSSGVVSWNGMTGVVNVTGADIPVDDTADADSIEQAITNEQTERVNADNTLQNNISTLNSKITMVDLGIVSDMASLISAISTLESDLDKDSTRFVKFNTNTPTDYWYQWEWHTGIVQKDDNINWTAVFAGTSGETLTVGSLGTYYSSREEKTRISTLETSNIEFYGFTLGQAKAITAKPYKRQGIAFGVWATTANSQKIIPFGVSIPANATTLTISEVTLYDTGKVTSGSYDVSIVTWRAS